jgi:DNA-binding Lrp family transcriptional regulator
MLNNRAKIMQIILSDSERFVLEALVQNSRYSPGYIGKMMGKSRNWVSRTIKGLVKSGAIRGYTTVVNPNLVQGARGTILFMKSNPREQSVSDKLLEMNELEALDGVSGEFSLLGSFRFDSHGDFEKLLDSVDHVVASSGAGKYQLVQVLNAYKKHGFRIIQPSSRSSPLTRKELDLLRIMYRYKPSSENPFPLTQERIGKMMTPQMSQSAVSKTIDRLTIKRVIVGYSIDIDFDLIGLPVKFFMRIKVAPGTAGELSKKLLDEEHVWDLYRTSEDYSLFASIRTNTVHEYNRFIRKLYENDFVIDTQSYISLEEWFMPFR